MVMHVVGSNPVDFSRVQGAIQAALHYAAKAKRDEYGLIRNDGSKHGNGIVQAYARHCDREALRALAAEGWTPPPELLDDARRADALTAGAGGSIRDLEFVRSQVLEEPLPPLNAELLFPADTSVPLGATSHVSQRWVTSGEAIITKGASAVPVASAGRMEERHGVAYVVCSVVTEFFQQLSIDYAGLRTFEAESKAAVRLVDERLNRIYWGGDVGMQLKGILNYPFLAKMVVSTVFDGSSGAAMAAAMGTVVDAPWITSKTVFAPNRLVVSPTLHRRIMRTQFAAGQDTTVGAFFLQGEEGKPTRIRVIEAAQELEANSPEMQKAGAPANMHGMLAFNDGAVKRVVIQEPTWLPMYQNGPLSQQHVVFAAAGGITIEDAGGAVLAFVSGS